MGVLHTKYGDDGEGYGKDIQIFYNSDLLSTKGNKDISGLLRYEQSVYNEFGANNFQEFIKKIRELFTGKDIEIIRRFSADEIGKYISSVSKGGEILEKQVEITIDTSKCGEDIKVKIGNLSTIPIKIAIDKFNPEKTVKAFNDTFQNHFYITDRWTKDMNHFIERLFADEAVSVKYREPGDPTSVYQDFKFANSMPNFPWGTDIELLKKAIKGGYESEIYQALDNAMEEIRKVIFDKIGDGASTELRRAMAEVWGETFIKNGQTSLDAVKFFSGGTGTNFLSGVQGAMGEFQTAVLFKYLTNKNLKPKTVNIIGNKYNTVGEQLRTDVQIFNAIGIQVKNFSTIGEDTGNLQFASKDRKISTTMHPLEFESKYGEIGMSDFLANYFFNQDFRDDRQNDFIDLREFLKDYLGEIMNMTMTDSLEDTFCFYLISGKYLVPGSEIIKALQGDLKDSIEITGPKQQYNNEYFSTTQSDNSTKPEFVKYWHHYHSGWRPTNENIKNFNNLVGHLVSIKTHFNPSKMMGEFKIF